MRHKFNAKKTVVDGFEFPSKLEAETYQALKSIHDCGAIKNLRLQVPYDLHGIGGNKVCVYQLDFLAELPNGTAIAFESKGVMTAVASLKLKLFSAEYGIPLVVVTSKNLATLRSISSIVRTTVKSYREAAFLAEIDEHFGKRKRKSKHHGQICRTHHSRF